MQDCCHVTSILSSQITKKIEYIQIPHVSELKNIEKIISKKTKSLCFETKGFFSCPLASTCTPIQNNSVIGSDHHGFKMLELFVLNSKFYGSDGMSVFEIDIKAFLDQNNLKLNLANDTFSYLFLKNELLYTFSKLPSNENILCDITFEQMLSSKHFNITAKKLLKTIAFFKSLYDHKSRTKRSNFVSDLFSSLMFEDKEDLQNIHVHLRDFIQYHNREQKLEKSITVGIQ